MYGLPVWHAVWGSFWEWMSLNSSCIERPYRHESSCECRELMATTEIWHRSDICNSVCLQYVLALGVAHQEIPFVAQRSSKWVSMYTILWPMIRVWRWTVTEVQMGYRDGRSSHAQSSFHTEQTSCRSICTCMASRLKFHAQYYGICLKNVKLWVVTHLYASFRGPAASPSGQISCRNRCSEMAFHLKLISFI